MYKHQNTNEKKLMIELYEQFFSVIAFYCCYYGSCMYILDVLPMALDDLVLHYHNRMVCVYFMARDY